MKKKSYFAAIQNLFNFLIFLILDLFIKIKKVKTNPNTLLLIKLDSIGDYILFRNLISVLKENRFRNYKITFCGNIAVKDLAVSYDKDLFDDFIWIDRQAFLTSISYKFRILKDLYSRGFDTAINSTYTREILFGDQIIKSVNARVRIGSSGSPDKTDKTRVFSDRFYTELIPQENSNLFEFQRNKEFIEKLINKETEIISTSITPLPDNYDPGFRNYILLFPGSKEESRNWNTDNFAAIGNYILNNSNYNLVIEGSSKDGQKAKEIIKNIRFKERVTDFTGKSSISGLVKVISGAVLLITIDTVALHIAAALNKDFICIANGYYFGRFDPYPPEMQKKGVVLFPEEVDKNTGKVIELKYGVNLNINSIRPERVIDVIREILALK